MNIQVSAVGRVRARRSVRPVGRFLADRMRCHCISGKRRAALGAGRAAG